MCARTVCVSNASEFLMVSDDICSSEYISSIVPADDLESGRASISSLFDGCFWSERRSACVITSSRSTVSSHAPARV
jgi:hypothetical protein